MVPNLHGPKDGSGDADHLQPRPRLGNPFHTQDELRRPEEECQARAGVGSMSLTSRSIRRRGGSTRSCSGLCGGPRLSAPRPAAGVAAIEARWGSPSPRSRLRSRHPSRVRGGRRGNSPAASAPCVALWQRAQLGAACEGVAQRLLPDVEAGGSQPVALPEADQERLAERRAARRVRDHVRRRRCPGQRCACAARRAPRSGTRSGRRACRARRWRRARAPARASPRRRSP